MHYTKRAILLRRFRKTKKEVFQDTINSFNDRPHALMDLKTIICYQAFSKRLEYEFPQSAVLLFVIRNFVSKVRNGVKCVARIS